MVSVLPDQFTLVRYDSTFSQVFLQLDEKFLPRVDELGKT